MCRKERGREGHTGVLAEGESAEGGEGLAGDLWEAETEEVPKHRYAALLRRRGGRGG